MAPDSIPDPAIPAEFQKELADVGFLESESNFLRRTSTAALGLLQSWIRRNNY
jgi:hypothetical protein